MNLRHILPSDWVAEGKKKEEAHPMESAAEGSYIAYSSLPRWSHLSGTCLKASAAAGC
jgi:hypothetical protein